jgi:hypothetical protein
MGLSASLAFMNERLALAMLVVCVPLTALWGYTLARCLVQGLRAARTGTAAMTAPGDSAPLDDLSWALLIALCGWFGALAYVAIVLVPRLQASRRPLLLVRS